MSKKHIRPGTMSPELQEHLAQLQAKQPDQAAGPEGEGSDACPGSCPNCGSCGECDDYGEPNYTDTAFVFIQNTLELAILAQHYTNDCTNPLFKSRVEKLEDKLTMMLENMASVIDAAGIVPGDEDDTDTGAN
jgi:hypothetical protein